MVRLAPAAVSLITSLIFWLVLAPAVESHHTGVSCGPDSHPGRAVCLPYADNSFAVNKLKQTGQLTYCFNQRALNYPNFRAQVRQTLTQHEQALGIKHIEVTGAYQSNTAAKSAGCDVWHSMPETHGCSGCAAWVHYLNEPVIIEYRWQAGYSDWKTTITHEVVHIYGLHEHYDDANFRSYRGTYGSWAHGLTSSPGTANDARTVMDFGMVALYGNLAWQMSEYDVKYACENMDPKGQFFTACGLIEEPCDPCWTGSVWLFSDGWAYDPAIPALVNPDGVAEWGPCSDYGGRYNFVEANWFSQWQEYDWSFGWNQFPAC